MSQSGRADAALRLSGLSKRFGAFRAVDAIDLSVDPGQIYGFVGPNGAGKTTTLRMIVGLLRPTAGRIEVCGVDAVRQPLEARRLTAFIGDRPFLYEQLTGGEFLRFVGGLWGMSRAEIDREAARWLARFELESWVGQPVSAYSHGMRQRLLLCAALLHSPRLLLLDEPLVGLDPRGAVRLKEVLRELAREHGVAVVLSTHTLDVVEQVCDGLALIDRGRVVVEGALQQLKDEHAAGGQRLEQLFLQLTARADATTQRPPHSEPADE